MNAEIHLALVAFLHILPMFRHLTRRTGQHNLTRRASSVKNVLGVIYDVSVYQEVLISPQVLVAEAKKISSVLGARELPSTDASFSFVAPRYPASTSTSPTVDGLSTYRALTPYTYGGRSTPESMSGYTSEGNTDEDMDSYPIFGGQDRAVLAQRTRRDVAADLGARMGYSLPPEVVPDPQISGAMVQFIISQYELAFSHPSKLHIDLIRGRFLEQIMSSKITRWSRYAGAQVLCALRQRGKNAEIGQFAPLIDQLGQLSINSRNDVNLADMTERLSAAFE
ncbi:hypothetical protein FRC09_007320, partial [Ceratobasidium sp. 395]